MNKKKYYFYLLLIFVFGLSIGLSYAFFSVQINGDSELVKTSTGTLSLRYQDGPEISLGDVIPGSSVSKTIYITNTSSLTAQYDLIWDELNNTIDNEELVIGYTCTSYKDYWTANQEESGECNDISTRPVITMNTPISIDNDIDPDITISLKATATILRGTGYANDPYIVNTN